MIKVNELEKYAIAVKDDAEILAYWGKTKKDVTFIECHAVSYASQDINECIAYLHETFELDVESMVKSIQKKKPVDGDLTLLFRQNDEYVIFNAEM